MRSGKTYCYLVDSVPRSADSDLMRYHQDRYFKLIENGKHIDIMYKRKRWVWKSLVETSIEEDTDVVREEDYMCNNTLHNPILRTQRQRWLKHDLNF
jgi:hypothetical protein